MKEHVNNHRTLSLFFMPHCFHSGRFTYYYACIQNASSTLSSPPICDYFIHTPLVHTPFSLVVRENKSTGAEENRIFLHFDEVCG